MKNENNIKNFLIKNFKFLIKRNLLEFFNKKNLRMNYTEVIELAYDFQAGSYIDEVEKRGGIHDKYVKELSSIIGEFIKSNSLVLDAGTGEMTSLSLLLKNIIRKPKKIYAFDTSWSRVYVGLRYAKKKISKYFKNIVPFVGFMEKIALPDKSVNVTMTNHSLESNKKKLKTIILELFRVTKDTIILCEPCYEINSKKGKKRMDKFGYIKNIEKIIIRLGGVVIRKYKIVNTINILNPTVCYIISPPKKQGVNKIFFTIPGTNFKLKKFNNFYHSTRIGLTFPILNKIPILKIDNAIISSLLKKVV